MPKPTLDPSKLEAYYGLTPEHTEQAESGDTGPGRIRKVANYAGALAAAGVLAYVLAPAAKDSFHYGYHPHNTPTESQK